ncbi:MAG: pilus assembly protein PilM [Pseudomonadota bacterium]
MNLDFLKLDLKKLLRKPSGGALLALDLRRTQICLCQVDRQGRIVLLERVPLTRDQEGSREALAGLLGRIVREYKLAGSPCITLLHRPDYTLLLTEAPQVPEAEIQAALRWKIADLIDFPVNEAVLDHFELQPLQPGETRQLYVVVSRERVIQERVDLLRGVGLEPAYIDIAEKAQRNLAARLPEDEFGVGVIEISDTEALLTVTRRGDLLFSRTLPLGVETLVEHISLSGGYSPDMARSFVASHGLANAEHDPDQHSLAEQALRQGVERLALELQRSLDYYDSRFRRGPIRALYFLFDGLYVPGLAAYVETLTGTPCRDFPQIEEAAAGHTAQQGCLLSYGAALRELLT